MKQLSELDISPAPWKVVDSYKLPKDGEWISVIESANGKTVSVPKYNDGSLIAAAPKMYERLRQFTIEVEIAIQFIRHREIQIALQKLADDNKAVLAEAAGESEVK